MSPVHRIVPFGALLLLYSHTDFISTNFYLVLCFFNFSAVFFLLFYFTCEYFIILQSAAFIFTFCLYTFIKGEIKESKKENSVMNSISISILLPFPLPMSFLSCLSSLSFVLVLKHNFGIIVFIFDENCEYKEKKLFLSSFHSIYIVFLSFFLYIF